MKIVEDDYMKVIKILSFLLVVFSALTVGIKSVQANEGDLYCEYVYGRGRGSFYGKNCFNAGSRNSSSFEVIYKPDYVYDKVLIVPTPATGRFLTIHDHLDHNVFIKDGKFHCPTVIQGKLTDENQRIVHNLFSLDKCNDIKEPDGKIIMIMFNTSEVRQRGSVADYKYYEFDKISGPKIRVADPEQDIREATCAGVFGDFYDDLVGLLKIIRILAPLMVLLLGTYDYMTAIFSKDAELLKKSNSRLVKRLILMAILFFLPILLNLLLGIVNASTCIEA